MASELSPRLREYLKAIGWKDAAIDAMTLETCLRHDLKLDGDNLLDGLEILATKFGVDMTGFYYEEYGHSEGALLWPLGLKRDFRNILHVLSPKTFASADAHLRPLTLRLIESALTQGAWAD